MLINAGCVRQPARPGCFLSPPETGSRAAFIGALAMKKTYRGPTLVRHENLALVTACAVLILSPGVRN